MLQRWLILLFANLAWFAAFGACGEGSAPNASPTDASVAADGSLDEAGGLGDAEGQSLVLVTRDLTTYVAQQTPLHASVQTNVASPSIAWTIDSVPAGSSLSLGPLARASGGEFFFTADAAGTYALRVTASAGGTARTNNVSITAVEAPVFFGSYREQRITGDGGLIRGEGDLRSVGTHGAAPVTLSCPVPSFLFVVSGAGVVAGRGADWIEAPAGTASRVAVTFTDTNDAGGTDQILATTTSASHCDAGGLLPLDRLSDSSLLNLFISQPRLSPDANRVAYYFRRQPSNAPTLLRTVAVDGGEAPRNIAPAAAVIDGGPDAAGAGPQQLTVRPKWLDPTHVGWVQAIGGAWRIAVAEDRDGSPLSVHMTCPGRAPKEFDFLSDGAVIASMPADVDVDRELVIFDRDSTGACVERRRWGKNPSFDSVNVVSNPIRAAVPHDFALSPDRSQVAYLQDVGTPPTGAVYVADVTGSRPPRQVSTTLPGVNGPRWIAGGALLTWSVDLVVDAGASDAGDAGDAGAPTPVTRRTGIGIVPAAGGQDRIVATDVGDASVAVGLGNGSSNIGYFGCAAGGAGPEPAKVAAALCVVALLAHRRRKRASSKTND